VNTVQRYADRLRTSAALDELLTADQAVTRRRILDLAVAPLGPLRRVLDHTVSNHVQVDIKEATQQLFARLYGRSVITIFPESAFAVFSKIEFLRGMTGAPSSTTNRWIWFDVTT